MCAREEAKPGGLEFSPESMGKWSEKFSRPLRAPGVFCDGSCRRSRVGRIRKTVSVRAMMKDMGRAFSGPAATKGEAGRSATMLVAPSSPGMENLMSPQCGKRREARRQFVPTGSEGMYSPSVTSSV